MSDGDNDISDVVQGVDLELRHERTSFPVTHKVQALGLVKPPFITTMSEYQLVTLAGAASGFLAGVVVCPLDVVKTRIQAQGKSNRYGSFVHAFGKIIREEGVKGLYRGVVPVTIGYLPTWTIYFTVYERAKRFYPRFLREHLGIQKDWLNHFAASLTAGSASSIAVNPIWVVKTRLMLQTGSEKVYYKSTLDAFKTMYRNEGLRVFYSGLLPSLFGLIHVGIHFPVYEALKRALHVSDSSQISHGSYHKLWRLIAASTISKVIASTVTYPHEILRTKMQMQREGDAPSVSVRKWIKTIYKKEGAGGFYAGYLTNLARTLPASAVTLVSFEYFKTYLLEISGKV
ncbi:uncharacterized protein CXQ87_005083 [Candidozyma duobushaemuli]|uniref:Uncharacterized protein n=2 Tax=Candidozyma TaxID=3303203 RepID=A0ABX8IDG3_9ASCO|nr:uncharacterized protein CXQ87_005083 [[Candida] duobushaemulonis]PVH14807.1 hypothetical protein CXQ87_005083 [[Candida] duobushaemulonis]QWU90102.1 hypothetical protein CA3LBN_004460 [[Candida] haemuloni]